MAHDEQARELTDLRRREQVASEVGAAFPVGLLWSVEGVARAVPMLLLGFPTDVDRGLLDQLADDDVLLDTFGPATRWGVATREGPDDDLPPTVVLCVTHVVALTGDHDAPDVTASPLQIVFDPALDARLLTDLAQAGWAELTVPETRDTDDEFYSVQLRVNGPDLARVLAEHGWWDPDPDDG